MPPAIFPTAIKSTSQSQFSLLNLFYLSCIGSWTCCSLCRQLYSFAPCFWMVVQRQSNMDKFAQFLLRPQIPVNDFCLQSLSVFYLCKIYLQWKCDVPWRIQLCKVSFCVCVCVCVCLFFFLFLTFYSLHNSNLIIYHPLTLQVFCWFVIYFDSY